VTSQNTSRRVIKTALWYVSAFVAALIGPVWVYRLQWDDLRFPWRVIDSDLSSLYALSQALGQSWIGITHPSLGAPFTANLSNAFIPDDLQCSILRLLSHVFNDPILAANVFFLLTFGLTAIAFLFFSDFLAISRLIGWPLSLAYSWLPYHFTRMDAGHLFLAAYFMLPLGSIVIVMLYRYVTGTKDSLANGNRWTTAGILVVTLGVGSSGAYYGLFFALLAATQLVLVRWVDRRQTARRVLTVILVAAGFVLAPFLRNIWARQNGLYEVLTRSPDESIQFGGSLTRLLLPWGVWLPKQAKNAVSPTEFEWTATPLLGSIAVVLVIILIARSIGSKNDADSPVTPLVFASLAAVLFYVTTGLGYSFALIVDSSFRTWNRLSIIILTLAFGVLGIFVSELLRTFSKRVVLGVVITLTAVATQLTPLESVGIAAEPDIISRTRFEELVKFGRVIERKVPPKCSILQLPLMMYPEGGMVGQVGNGNHLWLPLVTEGRRWSYGAPKGTKEGDFWKDLLAAPPEDAVRRAHDLGFCAVVLDTRSGFDPLALKTAANLKTLAREKGGYWLFRISHLDS
jgi:hypothetical protein